MNRRQKKKAMMRKWESITRFDHQWDQHYLYKILDFKLGLMADFFEGPDAVTLSAPAIGKEIREAANLAKKLTKGEYFDDTPYSDEVIEEAVKNGGFPSELQQKADLDRLMDLMKESLTWWD